MTAYGNLSPGVTASKSKSLDGLLREQNRVLELLRHWIAQTLMEKMHALLPHIAPRLSAPRLSFSRILVKLGPINTSTEILN